MARGFPENETWEGITSVQVGHRINLTWGGLSTTKNIVKWQDVYAGSQSDQNSPCRVLDQLKDVLSRPHW